MIATSLAADGLDATSAHHLATSTVAAFEGALLLARVQQSTEPVLSAAARLVADIESALTA